MKSALVLITMASAACDGDGYRVIVHVPGGPDRASRVEVSVLRSCGDADPLGVEPIDPVRIAHADGETSEPLGPVAPGRYGLYGRAWDEQCSLFAAACAPFDVETGGEGTIELFPSTLADPAGCDAGYACTSGSCTPADAGTDSGAPPEAGTCPNGLDECSGACVDTLSDAANCGGCGIRCGPGAICGDARCLCPGEKLDCGGQIGCVDAEHDPRHCGGCDDECAAREYCDGGTCACRPGLTRCALGFCTATASDPRRCGACDTSCAGEVCDLGDCAGFFCGIGRSECLGGCVDFQSDPLHCGGCGDFCAADEICVAGRCEPYGPAGDCDACPCDDCTGDYERCCTYPGASFPICLAVACG
ncbi:MAG: hypothetical protein HYY06_22190 [Deltaproteobacteria bacterium]|nr:hypothetical protein [Deltaproteobacteria bacterium]